MSAEIPFLESELEALRSQRGSSEAKEKVISALMRPRNLTSMIYRTSFAAAGLSVLIGLALLLTPRSASATSLDVANALHNVTSYHIRSYSDDPSLGLPAHHLEGETWVSQGVHRTVLYDEKGRPMPASIPKGIEKQINNERAKTYLDSMDDSYWGAPHKVRPTDFYAAKMSTGELVDGKLYSVRVWGIRHPGDGSEPPYVLYSCFSSVKILSKFMEDPALWDITRRVVIEGKTLDRFELKRFGKTFQVYVDPATNLPRILKIQFATDYYDYDTP
jgi:hypothetical protein